MEGTADAKAQCCEEVLMIQYGWSSGRETDTAEGSGAV